ncbi:MAG TPA: VWA domain-containing protein [Flavobacterium sp.]|mgnify:FL=1|uniref:nitric oxide reductase activation protein NorD n=1 Tax=Flavobacterium sp. TaxID=239 RepID=UPI001B68F339|nr:VWA domain-containing protein [Flavobacterium sp.]MBP7182639.1 VWA domain-containing protein [Flavobacterium sp.]MBP7318086.1 VWA domain-containing protein [Flavobacterium sp.]MBP8887921.1 VWA domain-containing protein [Flavobacterium sp.]HRM46258.1 VWA domain-containing protein [Flavobacterium sp.]
MGFEIDEYIVGKFFKHLKKSKKISPEILARTVTLTSIKPRLTILARALTGNPIEIFPAEREGGYKNNNFFLPISFAELSTKEDNLTFYLFRILYLSVQQRLNLNWTLEEQDQPLALSQLKAFETSDDVLAILFEEFSIDKKFHTETKQHFIQKGNEKIAPDFSWMYGKWMQNEKEVKSDSVLENFSDKAKTANENKPLTTLKSKAVEEVVTVELDKKQQEDYVLLHNFEKAETAEEFNGTWRDFDGSDELEEHQEALEELNMKYTVRVDDTAHSVYQSDFVENTTISESAEIDANGFHLTYNEWDFSKRIYKENFCKVYPKSQQKTDSHYYKKTIAKNASTLLGLRKMLTNVNNKMQQQKRQTQGDEFDIDAITDLYVDVHSKRTPSENIYISNRKKEKDLSILILLDISLSSDGYAAGNRVIDVEKEVSILFGEILNEFNIDFCIDSFYSKTRNFSTYLTVKDFDENWNIAKNKIGAIEPNGYTRIGAALRHAGARLDTRNTKNKWVILISDGKPNDYDKYEGKYGVNDVKQALRELNNRNINSYALAIEAQAKYYLPQMFGQNHYQILTTPVELLHSLVHLYEKIKHQK